jgi:hypothetical protein
VAQLDYADGDAMNRRLCTMIAVALVCAGTASAAWNWWADAMRGAQRLVAGITTRPELAYWRMDEGAGTNAYDATTNGTSIALTTSWSILTPPVSFSNSYSSLLQVSAGGTKGTIASNAIVSVKNISQRTVAMWVYPGRVSGNYQPLWFEATPAASTRFLVYMNGGADGDVRLGGRVADADGFTALAYTGGSVLTATNWWHIAAVFDGVTGTNKIYVQGVDRTSGFTSKKSAFANTTSGRPIYVGYDTTYYCDTRVDDIRVYNTVLTSNQIWQLAQGTDLTF